jgi:hypothetical protein
MKSEYSVRVSQQFDDEKFYQDSDVYGICVKDVYDLLMMRQHLWSGTVTHVRNSSTITIKYVCIVVREGS